MKGVRASVPVFVAQFCQQAQVFGRSVAHFSGDGQQKTIPVLDGIRAIACLSVLTFHMNLLARFHGLWIPALDGVGAFVSATALSGEAGVILFFVLSGFLLFAPYAKSMLFDSDWPSLRRFYVRRIFRILPGYYVALFLMTVFLAPEYLQQAHWHDLWLFLTFRMDFPSTFQRLNAPFWTLALEFQFYMVLPIMAWFMRLIVGRGSLHWRLAKLTFCLLLVLAWGFGTHYWGVFLAGAQQPDFLLPRTIVDVLKPYIYGTIGKFFEVFAIGMLTCMVSIYLQYGPSRERMQRNARRLSPLLFGLGLGVLGFMACWHFYLLSIAATFHFLDPYQSFLLTYKDLLPPVCYAIGYGLCLFALVYGYAWLKRPFEWFPLRWLGLISYSLYMWHYPIILHFLSFFQPRFQNLGWSQTAQWCVYWLWLLLTAFPISIILYRFVEVPGIRLGEKLCQRWEKLPAVTVVPVNTSPKSTPVAERCASFSKDLQ